MRVVSSNRMPLCSSARRRSGNSVPPRIRPSMLSRRFISSAISSRPARLHFFASRFNDTDQRYWRALLKFVEDDVRRVGGERSDIGARFVKSYEFGGQTIGDRGQVPGRHPLHHLFDIDTGDNQRRRMTVCLFAKLCDKQTVVVDRRLRTRAANQAERFHCWVVVLFVISPTSYSGFETPMIHLSNQPTMCCKRSMRCHGCPERESSCDSFGKRTITVGIFRYFSARNMASPPGPVGVRQSTSPRININGVWILLT